METNHQNCPNCGHSLTKQELWMKNNMLCPICQEHIGKHYTIIPMIILIVIDYLIVKKLFHQEFTSSMFFAVGCLLVLVCRVLLLCCYPLLDKLRLVYLKEK